MALTNHERIGKALELLKDGLGPFVEREFESAFKDQARARAHGYLNNAPDVIGKPLVLLDAAALLRLMWQAWNEVFRNTLGRAERSLVSELREVRNK